MRHIEETRKSWINPTQPVSTFVRKHRANVVAAARCAIKSRALQFHCRIAAGEPCNPKFDGEALCRNPPNAAMLRRSDEPRVPIVGEPNDLLTLKPA